MSQHQPPAVGTSPIRTTGGDHRVAWRIGPPDLTGLLRKGLEVRPGTRAFLFEGGRYVGTLAPGRHTFATLGQRLHLTGEGEPTAIVVDDGELGFDFAVDSLHSADHHDATLQAQASLRLARPEVFLANLMRDRDSYTVADLGQQLAAEIRQSLGELVAEHRGEELQQGRVRDRLELELLSRWKVSLERCGFMLNRFRVLSFHLAGLERAGEALTAAADTAAEQEAQRQARETLFEQELADFRLDTGILEHKGVAEVERRQVEVDHEVRRMHQEAERLERRQPLLQRLLEDENLARMTELKSEEEWRRFQRQVDRDHLLADADWQRLRVGEEEAELERQSLLRRLRATAQADQEELELRRRYQLKLLELQQDTGVTEEQLRQERLQLESELENRRRVFDQEVSEREQRLHQEEAERRSLAQQQVWKIEQLETIRQMGKDREAARKLKDQVTAAEAFAAMTPDQILAMAVAQNPSQAADIAAAFRAAKAGEASERERELYERMLAEVKSAHERSQSLDHDKMRMVVEAEARQRQLREELDEREKARAERIAARPHGTRVPVPEGDDEWIWCDTHEIKYRSGARCPLCARSQDG